MDKQTKKILVIGGIGIAAYYLYTQYQASQAAAAATTPAPTPLPVTTDSTGATNPVATTAAAVFDPATDLQWVILDVDAYQQPVYNLAIHLEIVNNAAIAVTIDNISATVTFTGVSVDLMTATPPTGTPGNLGTLNLSASITIPPGSSFVGWLQVAVPKTAAANYYLSTLNDANSYAATHNTNKGTPMVVSGTATVNGASIPLSLPYYP
jgi:hypothetical protein